MACVNLCGPACLHARALQMGKGISAKSGTNGVILEGSSFLFSGLHAFIPPTPPSLSESGVFSVCRKHKGEGLKML